MYTVIDHASKERIIQRHGVAAVRGNDALDAVNVQGILPASVIGRGNPQIAGRADLQLDIVVGIERAISNVLVERHRIQVKRPVFGQVRGELEGHAQCKGDDLARLPLRRVLRRTQVRVNQGIFSILFDIPNAVGERHVRFVRRRFKLGFIGFLQRAIRFAASEGLRNRLLHLADHFFGNRRRRARADEHRGRHHPSHNPFQMVHPFHLVLQKHVAQSSTDTTKRQ